MARIGTVHELMMHLTNGQHASRFCVCASGRHFEHILLQSFFSVLDEVHVSHNL